MRFLKYWWRRFITWLENYLFKKTQKEQDLDAPVPLKEDLDAPVPLKEDLAAPVPANNNGTNVPSLCYGVLNPSLGANGVLNPFLGANAPLNFGCVAKERNSVSLIQGREAKERNSVSDSHGYCRVANERHYVSNNNLEEDKMGLFQSKVIKFLGGTPAPTSEDECKQQIKELEKKKLKFQNKEGVTPIKPVGQEKLLSSNISPISMRSNNDNSNWIDPNDLNNTFEYQNVDKKALNAMGTKIKQDVKQEIKKEMDDRFAESTNNINQLKEDMKEVKKDIKDIKDEQIDLKKMIARSDAMLAEMKQQTADIRKQTEKMEEDRKKSEENQKAHEEVMRYLWDKLDEWNGIKESTREGNDNRESTNTSLSSFKYKNPFRNNKRQPKMERPDMAHSHNEN